MYLAVFISTTLSGKGLWQRMRCRTGCVEVHSGHSGCSAPRVCVPR
jgi:hypothetical protein